MKATLFVLATLFTVNLRAAGVPTELLSGFEQTWETSLPTAQEILDQGKTPYCTLYAMSSFLELWGDTNGTRERLPTLDPAYLALAYNREASSGSHGTKPLWLLTVVEKLGILPRGSEPAVREMSWPITAWQDWHLHLIPASTLDPILRARYRHPSVARDFTAKDYLHDVVRLDGRDLNALLSTSREDGLDEAKGVKPTKPKVEYRYGSRQDTDSKVRELARHLGTPVDGRKVKAAALYDAVKKALYRGRPALLSLNLGLTKDRFRHFDVLDGNDLVPVGKGRASGHSVVAVAHCESRASADRTCERFTASMKKKRVAECVVIQNSWGVRVNARGYACLSPSALARMLKGAYLSK